MRNVLTPVLFVLVSSCSAEPEEHELPSLGADDGLPALSERVGMSQQLVWGDDQASKGARAGQLARLNGLGVRNERIDFSWHKLERAPGVWQFDALDAVVRDATSAGVSLIAVACYGNPIYPSAGGNGGPLTNLPLDNPPEVYFPPTDPAHYADYVAAIATRYGDRVKRFELWNEENLGYRFWRPEASGAAYAKYIEPAVRAGKAACPDCSFVVGGLSMPNPIPRLEIYRVGPKFLEEMYAASPELDSFIDGVAFHPYPMPKDPPEKETAAFPDRVQGSQTTQTEQMRAVVREHGRDLPLWITENGWPTNPGVPRSDEDIARIFGMDSKIVKFGRALLGDEAFATVVETLRGVSERDQGRYLVRSVLIAAGDRIPVISLYGLDDYPIETEINQESAFGVFRVDGSEKPAAAALRVLLSRFGSFRFVADVRSELGIDDAYRAYALRDGRTFALAIWRWRDGSSSLRLASPRGDAVVLAEDGREIARIARGDHGDVEVGPDVRYVVWTQ